MKHLILAVRPEFENDPAIPAWLTPQQGNKLPDGGPKTNGGGSGGSGGDTDSGTQKKDDTGGAGGIDGCWNTQTMIMLVAMFAIFYLFIIRPQRKQESQRQQMLAAVKKGDAIITTSGLHGVVEAIDQATVTLVVDGTHMVFDRAAVGRVAGGDAPAAPNEAPKS